MSLDHSSNERAISGITYKLYWCYQCHRTVRIALENPTAQILCPRCFGQFLYEIDIARPRLVVEFTEFDPSPEARMLEALSLMLDPPVRQTNQRVGWSQDVGIQAPWRQNQRHDWPWRRRRGHRDSSFNDDMDYWGPQSGILARPRRTSWVIFRPTSVRPTPDDVSNDNDNNREAEGRVDPREYYEGSGVGLNELIEELTENDRPGPPPVPDSAINALPIVKITEKHLLNDSETCAICMEEFKVGGEAKELPCNHIFHSDCIHPWLTLHNSCPICRHHLPLSIIAPSNDDDDDDDSRRSNQRCLRWRRLLWPFHTNNNITATHRDAADDESRFHSCSIL